MNVQAIMGHRLYKTHILQKLQYKNTKKKLFYLCLLPKYNEYNLYFTVFFKNIYLIHEYFMKQNQNSIIDKCVENYGLYKKYDKAAISIVSNKRLNLRESYAKMQRFKYLK